MSPRTVRWYLLFIPALILGLGQTSIAQIPNPGFENWTSGEPDGWTTSNNPPLLVTITQSTDVHGGAKSLQGAVVSFSTFAFAPSLLSGSEGHGFPYTSRPGALHGFYKYTPVSADQFTVTVVLSHNGTGIAGGAFTTTTASGSAYREFVANLLYSAPDNPDTGFISCAIHNSPSAHVGSTFLLDDLAFGPAATDVREVESPQSFLLKQNYPNPFNPSTNIAFEIPSAGFVSLKVYNLLGQEVATLVNEELQAGSYKATLDGGALTSGMYFYTLRTGQYSDTKRAILMK